MAALRKPVEGLSSRWHCWQKPAVNGAYLSVHGSFRNHGAGAVLNFTAENSRIDSGQFVVEDALD